MSFNIQCIIVTLAEPNKALFFLSFLYILLFFLEFLIAFTFALSFYFYRILSFNQLCSVYLIICSIWFSSPRPSPIPDEGSCHPASSFSNPDLILSRLASCCVILGLFFIVSLVWLHCFLDLEIWFILVYPLHALMPPQIS